jgi:hypothetical protein
MTHFYFAIRRNALRRMNLVKPLREVIARLSFYYQLNFVK